MSLIDIYDQLLGYLLKNLKYLIWKCQWIRGLGMAYLQKFVNISTEMFKCFRGIQMITNYRILLLP